MYNALALLLVGKVVEMRNRIIAALGDLIPLFLSVRVKSVIPLLLIAFLPVSANAAPKILFVHTDHLGTPQAMTDSSPTPEVVWRADYDPFGAATITGDASLPIRFPGQYYDEETGLHYNYFRDYDPSLGRYIQSDPRGVILDYSDPQRMVAARIGIPISPGDSSKINHLYGYANQSPVVFSDPTGEAVVAFPLVPIAAGAALLCYLTGTCQDFAQACYDAFSSDDDRQPESCDEEWERAYEICEREIGGDNRGITGGHTDIFSCAKGLVSQRCGGNRVQ